ncbi:hypothetical protein C2G38_2145923 [Gigaspora rosea]|uniref:Uncharacterized protein n=1 Tax=Gigaspora rosea TaxID=44941 RepID=A0A397UKE6_9GLOM|nr:hypothetical protein C2G38_2145923 [Gigaspora rosea]
MSGLSISIIIDKKDRTLSKPFNNRPGYDMRKIHHFSRGRYVEILESSDLMMEHWDHECDKPKTDFGCALIIQRIFHRFKEREPSNARISWNSLANDNTPNEKKFLGLTPRKVKNPISLDQIKMRLNKEYGEYIKKYNRLPYIAEFEISRYQEYIIPYDWIGRKKNQLRNRFQERHLELET